MCCWSTVKFWTTNPTRYLGSVVGVHYPKEIISIINLNTWFSVLSIVLTVSFAISTIHKRLWFLKHFAIFVWNSFLKFISRNKVNYVAERKDKVTISITLFYSFSKHLRTRMLFLKMKLRKPHFIIVGSFFFWVKKSIWGGHRQELVVPL